MSEITFRWLEGPTCTNQEWAAVEEVLKERKWMSLSREYSRILIAEQDGEIAFCVFQGLPYCGPLYVPKSMRGTGVAKKLSDDMVSWLQEIGARGWVAVAESPHTEKYCRELGMVKVEFPVYMMPFAGGMNAE